MEIPATDAYAANLGIATPVCELVRNDGKEAYCRTVFTVRQLFFTKEYTMETRVAVMSIIVEDATSVEKLNAILHQYGEFIIGRMGLPYRKRNINIISIALDALDAPQDTISALAGKVGTLRGVSVKTAYSGVVGKE